MVDIDEGEDEYLGGICLLLENGLELAAWRTPLSPEHKHNQPAGLHERLQFILPVDDSDKHAVAAGDHLGHF